MLINNRTVHGKVSLMPWWARKPQAKRNIHARPFLLGISNEAVLEGK